jgi:hypothetical protein
VTAFVALLAWFRAERAAEPVSDRPRP